MVTAFPSNWEGRMKTTQRDRKRVARWSKKYYTKTHHLALRLCSLFPNNALQQLVPKITEHAKTEEGDDEDENVVFLKTRTSKKLADEKCISMISLHSRFHDFLKFIPSMWILTKLTYLLLQNRLPLLSSGSSSIWLNIGVGRKTGNWERIKIPFVRWK